MSAVLVGLIAFAVFCAASVLLDLAYDLLRKRRARRELDELTRELEREKADLLVLQARLAAETKMRDQMRNPNRHKEWS